MIEWDKSAELNNCTIEWLKARFVRFPKSHKHIIRVCDRCGDERSIEFCGYHELCQSCSEKKRYEDPKEHERHSAIMKKLYKENPAMGKMLSESQKKSFIDDPARTFRMSNAMKKMWAENPESWNDRNEKQKGGNDIVMHHWLYDDADLSKYTMPMTRSEHTAMHHRMVADGYEVQHINSDTDDNGLWGYK